LIAPSRRNYYRDPGDMADRPLFMGEVPEWLPNITCVGTFMDVSPAGDMTTVYPSSYLMVVWYQDDFALPIDNAVLADLRALDWERLATDVED
jgi:hypothetical protein